jgi:uncharacterized repeat protein (TIGR01451 family)
MRKTIFAALVAALTTLVAALAAVGLAAHSEGAIERISVSSTGAQGNQDSEASSISSDARYVAFVSFADNLVPEDTNGAADIFVRDRLDGTTERVSVGANGRQSDGDSGVLGLMGEPDISADGRFVAFASMASNLAGRDSNQNSDVFVHDRATGTTELISVSLTGDPASGIDPSISGDGRFVSFTSAAFDLVPGDTGFRSHIYVRDRQSGTTERVDVANDGTLGDNEAFTSELSADGRYVAFDTFSDNLVPNDGDGSVDVFVHDRQTHVTEGISTVAPSTGLFRHSSLASITRNGRFVGFSSDETNIVPGDTNNWTDAFLYDRDTDTVERVSVGTGGVQGDRGSFSPHAREDGRVVIFASDATNLVPGDTNDAVDVYRRNLDTGVTERLVWDDQQFGFDIGVDDVTPDAVVVPMSTRAELQPEVDVGFFASDVYALDLRPSADLAVAQTDAPDPATARGQVTYTVTVRNDGPGAASAVTLTDVLPDATFVSATPSQGTCARAGKGRRDGTLTCELGSIASGASATVSIVVSPSKAGTITNTASVQAAGPDPDRADNTSTETTTVGPR